MPHTRRALFAVGTALIGCQRASPAQTATPEGVQIPKSPAVLRIVGNVLPLGDVVTDLLVRVGPNEPITNPHVIQLYLNDRNIRPDVNFLAHIASGTYVIPDRANWNPTNPSQSRALYLGAPASPETVKLVFDASATRDAIAPEGTTFRIAGVQIIGRNNFKVGDSWSKDTNGGALTARSSNSQVFADNVHVLNYYYHALASDGGGVIGRGFVGFNAGDCALHARVGGVIDMPGAKVGQCGAVDALGSVLGYGALAEGGQMNVPGLEAYDCLVAGLGTAATGRAIAYGANLHDNRGRGFVALSGSAMSLTAGAGYPAAKILRNGSGGYVEYAVVDCYGSSSADRALVSSNKGDGISCGAGGKFRSGWIDAINNAGVGYRADGPGADLTAKGRASGNRAGPFDYANGAQLDFTEV